MWMNPLNKSISAHHQGQPSTTFEISGHIFNNSCPQTNKDWKHNVLDEGGEKY